MDIERPDPFPLSGNDDYGKDLYPRRSDAPVAARLLRDGGHGKYGGLFRLPASCRPDRACPADPVGEFLRRAP